MNVFNHGFTCYWRLEHFPLYKRFNGFTFKSQLFQVPMLKNSTWNLELRSHEFTEMKLLLRKDSEQECNFYLRMYVLTKEGWKIRSKKIFCSGLGHGEYKSSFKLIPDYSFFREMEDYIVNGCLTLRCNIYDCFSTKTAGQCVMTSRLISPEKIIHMSMKYFVSLTPNELVNFSASKKSRYCPHCRTKKVKTASNQTLNKNKADINDVFNDSKELLHQFKEKKFCYVTLHTASRDFDVHKALLCARSPVFSAMFEQSMTENSSNIVNIDDIDSDTLSLLLQFLHLGVVAEMDWEASAKLYYAADKYQIELLKKECSYSLQTNLSDETIYDCFILADRHQDMALQQAAQDYFNVNSKAILQSFEWKDMVFDKPTLVHEILYRFGNSLV